MPKNSLYDKAAIVGIGQTEFSKDSGRTELQLAAEASLSAIKDAGLAPADIDGMVTFAADSNDELALMRNPGIPKIRWTARTRVGGGGPGQNARAPGRAGSRTRSGQAPRA